MRGALGQAFETTKDWRIIPADAGSTSMLAWPTLLRWDHPRGCGEHMDYAGVIVENRGSSPRMRGAPGQAAHQGHHQGIIPADAGSTRHRINGAATGADHPRGCGEHDMRQDWDDGNRGSSPRMRGAHAQNSATSLNDRIIPADAGSTALMPYTSCGYRDHPRGCGEHSW